ncbi:MAG TPA: hypothetical protein VMT20_20280 [Terriglobia bacterium]|nr:hypothetical protein [Terriglobia bacterium]
MRQLASQPVERSVELANCPPGPVGLEPGASQAQATTAWPAPLDVHPNPWNEQDLARRLCHVLDIAQQAVKRLAPNGYTDSVEPGNNVRPEKVISETALLLVAASGAAEHDDVRAHVEKVAQLLIFHARSERMLLGACLEPALALDFAQAHVCLHRLGYHDPAFDKLLRKSLHSQARFGHERVPHRMLEQEWLMNGCKRPRPSSLKRTPRAALNSVLNHPMDLLNGSRDDIYAFTHALIYATDFNLYPHRLPREKAVILAEAEVALARCLDEQDYDLAAEVLLAWPLTGKSWSAAAAFGFQVLARVEDEAGFLPAPSTRLERLNSLQGSERRAYLLATAYHTVYVMGLLCAAALQPGRTPPLEISTRGVRNGSASAILQFLELDDRKAHWRVDFDRLKDRERDAIAGLLLNIALRRKAVQRDFGALHKLLEIAYVLGLAGTPAASQAAELLERVASVSRWSAPRSV